jgi:hypothetical protein
LESSGPGDGSAALSSLTEGLAAIRLELGSIRTELGSRRAESDSDLHAELDALRAKNERLVEEGTTLAKIIRIAKKAIA